jgi:hypothetical protein
MSRFEKVCLSEYAEIFETVSVDPTCYAWRRSPLLEDLSSQWITTPSAR